MVSVLALGSNSKVDSRFAQQPDSILVLVPTMGL